MEAGIMIMESLEDAALLTVKMGKGARSQQMQLRKLGKARASPPEGKHPACTLTLAHQTHFRLDPQKRKGINSCCFSH